MKLGYSFCPNDTFIFYALAHHKVASPWPVEEVLEDVETLNRWALQGRLPLTKISYAAYGHLRQQYVALRAGGALGRGVGPLLVAQQPIDSLAGKRIAIPGRYTTAFLLLSLHTPGFIPVELRYDQIMPAVAQGTVDAGLIIHESRFTYHRHGLVQLLDLGEWWEERTGLPLPLGAILARRDLGENQLTALNLAVRDSLLYARTHPDEPIAYIRQHAAELDDQVIWAHIHTYVNDFSLDVGSEGEQAVEELFRQGQAAGLLPPHPAPLFVGQSTDR